MRGLTLGVSHVKQILHLSADLVHLPSGIIGRVITVTLVILHVENLSSCQLARITYLLLRPLDVFRVHEVVAGVSIKIFLAANDLVAHLIIDFLLEVFLIAQVVILGVSVGCPKLVAAEVVNDWSAIFFIRRQQVVDNALSGLINGVLVLESARRRIKRLQIDSSCLFG